MLDYRKQVEELLKEREESSLGKWKSNEAELSARAAYEEDVRAKYLIHKTYLSPLSLLLLLFSPSFLRISFIRLYSSSVPFLHFACVPLFFYAFSSLFSILIDY